MTHTGTHMAPEFTGAGARWLKSSYSDGSGNNCVEVADLGGTAYAGVAIRDSKTPQGPALLVAPASFATFIQDICQGRDGR
ncbi:DUF397 domain-containing protein [Streptomyces sp. NBC_00078]|uniref:DUF397 domain-containing protein n=1 Tax=unclassified Streptomyces TaxID=2593676 RepID=UPI002259F978|nr:DUF397 domain-containing protein [Streptomyces sp. NBC_00078]MCX5421950.1 DUF397 domain-containing protein [Streptomyces sp. NBC_00078]